MTCTRALQDKIEVALSYLGSRVPQEYLDRWNLITDIDTNEIRLFGLREAELLWMDLDIMLKHRKVYWISELDRAEDGGYIPCIAIEDEPEYFKTDWNWGTNLKIANKLAEEKNLESGINPKEAWLILMGCFRLAEEKRKSEKVHRKHRMPQKAGKI
jgi:hypothetical protein